MNWNRLIAGLEAARDFVKRVWLPVLLGAVVVFALTRPAMFYYLVHDHYRELLAEAGVPDAGARLGSIFLSVLYVLLLPYAVRWFFLGQKGYAGVVATVVLLCIEPLVQTLSAMRLTQQDVKDVVCGTILVGVLGTYVTYRFFHPIEHDGPIEDDE